MREQVAKKQERQNLIETQKTEAVESQKKKGNHHKTFNQSTNVFSPSLRTKTGEHKNQRDN